MTDRLPAGQWIVTNIGYDGPSVGPKDPIVVWAVEATTQEERTGYLVISPQTGTLSFLPRDANPDQTAHETAHDTPEHGL